MNRVVRAKFWFCNNWRCCAKIPRVKRILCPISWYTSVRGIPTNEIKLVSVISNQVTAWPHQACILTLLKYSRSTYFGLFRYFELLFFIEKKTTSKFIEKFIRKWVWLSTASSYLLFCVIFDLRASLFSLVLPCIHTNLLSRILLFSLISLAFIMHCGW